MASSENNAGPPKNSGPQELKTSGKKLSWDEIKDQYDQQWVELIDFDWDMTEPDPKAGIVRVHAKDKKVFRSLIMQDRPKRSAILYVGEILPLQDGFFSMNLHQWKKIKSKSLEE